jgi:uncharacterized protein YodC (DUF2158 family)
MSKAKQASTIPFQDGDTVVLRSGSKPMTVIAVSKKKNGEVSLCWWDEYKQQICQESLPAHALRLAPVTAAPAAAPAAAIS